MRLLGVSPNGEKDIMTPSEGVVPCSIHGSGVFLLKGNM